MPELTSHTIKHSLFRIQAPLAPECRFSRPLPPDGPVSPFYSVRFSIVKSALVPLTFKSGLAYQEVSEQYNNGDLPNSRDIY